MSSIAVIVSTYNGEKYLRTQLDSILVQEGVDVHIFIRDDGSTDGTRSILADYVQKHSNVHVTFGENIGYARSFYHMLFECRQFVRPEANYGIRTETIANTDTVFDYYAFSDQDDYWKPQKLVEGIKKLKKFKSKPSLYYSNLQHCDKNLNPRSITDLHKRKNTLESVTTRRSIAGCTMVFNRKLYEDLVNNHTPDVVVVSHDNYLISLCFALGGTVVCDPNAYILYRQHTGNSSGETSGLKNRVAKELKEIKKVRVKKAGEALMAQSLLENYGEQMSEEYRKKIKMISELDKFGISRLKAFFSPKFTTGDIRLTAVGKIKILFGWN